ncbi:MAG: phosphoribosyl-AMP cyclohydrolase [Actinobacteria bacterium]|jgi:phosphoribosyl-AMP cyclohydrolase|nr:phosphoribosyl-AMP cyclohydrolase [Actinomycetota bacterium]NDH80766.1 phosphoribosyl-AMP cyclohydrolase [Actinomycetota bacterium]NDH98857.1 phosphoribosyl-AMP cyclohydrolase [Actinomycetota bacterium]NDI07315.1 phosphoribosyl-AMP cyclohydrolase [Actinomycetota bacterium]
MSNYQLSAEVRGLLKDVDLLIPGIVQDAQTKDVLMLAYVNQEALAQMIATGAGTYWSRSRKEIWVKGASSGHTQKVMSLALDCDGDALLISVEQIGAACHTGEKTCFHQPIKLA